jgi:hypothetical protein
MSALEKSIACTAMTLDLEKNLAVTAVRCHTTLDTSHVVDPVPLTARLRLQSC